MKITRKFYSCFALVFGIFFSGALLAGAHGNEHHDNPRHDKSSHEKYGHHNASPEQRLEKLTAKLELTKAQKRQVGAILEERRVRMQEARAALRAVRQETHDQIKQLLNEEQQTKFDAMHEQHTGDPKPKHKHKHKDKQGKKPKHHDQ